MINIQRDFSLLSCNTFGIEATASVLYDSDCADDLSGLVRSLPDPSAALVLGGGSNILMVSERYDVVIRPMIKGISIIDETDEYVWVQAGAGERWDDFVSWCVSRHFSGVENLSHIPGTVGACPIQNIGAYGVEAKETIETVETIEKNTGKPATFNNQQCELNYRDSVFKKNKDKYIITAVQFRLSKRFEPKLEYAELETELSRFMPVTIENMRQAIIHIRSRKLPDPEQLGNVASFFKNPAINTEKKDEIDQLYPKAPLYPMSPGLWKISAAWLIQQCGWKGVREGKVGTYSQQPLVLVNYGGAKGMEILCFAQKIIDSVHSKFGIKLAPEVNIV